MERLLSVWKKSRGSSTNNEPKELFTSKERDIEIGLDYFGARYYNEETGRRTSTDRFVTM
jgi:RHS repeat-associated protein